MLDGAQNPESSVLLPHIGFMTPPGGQLLHKLAEHTDIVVDVDIEDEGEIAATGMRSVNIEGNGRSLLM